MASVFKVVFIFCVFFFLPGSGYAEQRVLLISSYHPGFPTFFQQIEGIRSELEPKGIELDVEFMDSKRFLPSEIFPRFRRFLQFKLGQLPAYNVIITSDDNALEFALEHGQELFANVPIVFCGVNNVELARAQNRNDRITGVIESISLTETIQLARNLFPMKNRLYVISDATPSGQGDLQSLRKLVTRIKDMEIVELLLVHMTWEQLSERLKMMEHRGVILLLSAYRDRENRKMDFKDSLELIVKSARAPIFHLWQHGIGDGILGGKVVSHYRQGRLAASMAILILDGQSPGQIPVLEGSYANKYIFDSRQLDRFGISIDSLPRGAEVRFRKISLWERFGLYVLCALAIVIIQSLLILLLVTKHSQLRKKEKALSESQMRFKVSFLNSPIGMIIFDRNGLMIDANEAAGGIFGVKPSKQPPKFNILDDPNIPERDKQKIKKGQPVKYKELRYSFDQVRKQDAYETQKSGVSFLSGSITPLALSRSDAASRFGFLTIIQDITDHRNAIRRLSLDEKCFETLYKLSRMIDQPERKILYFALEGAMKVTESRIGYIDFIKRDPSAAAFQGISEKAAARCGVNTDPLLFQRFHSGFRKILLKERIPLIVNKVDRRKHEKNIPMSHPKVIRHIHLPLTDKGEVVLIAAVGNKQGDYDQEDVRQLTLVLSGMWRIIQRKRSEQELKNAHQELEMRVEERTRELAQTNLKLQEGIVEREKDKKSLQAYSDRLSLASRAGGIGVWEWDIQSGELMWDDQMKSLYGYEQDLFPVKYDNWRCRVHPEDIDAVEKSAREALGGKADFHTEFRIVLPDQGVRNIKAAALVQFNPDGSSSRMIGVNWDITERKLMEEEIRRLANTDPLTGAFNRRQFMVRAAEEIDRSSRYGNSMALLILDVDHFKSINDTFGHEIGDKVLQKLVEECLGQLRGSDFFCRLGGEEFSAILPETDIRKATVIAERLRAALENLKIRTSGKPVTFTVSIGVAEKKEEDQSVESIMKRADRALYRAKNSGRNRVFSR